MKNCGVCPNTFTPRLGRENLDLYCSRQCNIKAQATRRKATTKPREERTCRRPECGAAFTAYVRVKKDYCSGSCREKDSEAYREKWQLTAERKLNDRPPQGFAAIYYLHETGSDAVRYIGQTSEKFKQRLSKHRTSHRPCRLLSEWLTTTPNVDITPVMFLPIDSVKCFEAVAIQAGFDAGWPLLNLRNDGCAEFNVPSFRIS